MTGLTDSRAILGIDPTSRGLAFVYFEGGALLDWGTRGRIGEELAAFTRLFARCPADVVVLEDASGGGSQRRPRVRRLLRALAREATKRGIGVVTVARADVRREWIARGRSTKYAVALEIAERFQPLQMILPRLRKCCRSEEARTEIFDAASLVLHAFAGEASEAV